MKPIKFTIPIAPITKKNHQQIIYHSGRPMVIPSKQYLQYEKDAMWFLPNVDTIKEITDAIAASQAYAANVTVFNTMMNVKAVFYMPTKRRVDLTNLLQALLDVLVKYGILADDNSKVVFSVDGSYVDYDKENPRTEVEIWNI